jgi:hypothetical protein
MIIFRSPRFQRNIHWAQEGLVEEVGCFVFIYDLFDLFINFIFHPHISSPFLLRLCKPTFLRFLGPRFFFLLVVFIELIISDFDFLSFLKGLA